MKDLPASPIRPLHDLVVLAAVKPEGSLIETIGNDEYDLYVVAVGPGRQTDQFGPDGQPLLNKPTVKYGDRVSISPDPSRSYRLDVYGHKFVVLNHFAILGVTDTTVETFYKNNPLKGLTLAKTMPHHLPKPPSGDKGPHKRN